MLNAVSFPKHTSTGQAKSPKRLYIRSVCILSPKMTGLISTKARTIKMKLTELLGPEVIYSVTVESLSRLLDPSRSIAGSFVFFFLFFINVKLTWRTQHIYIYISAYLLCVYAFMSRI